MYVNLGLEFNHFCTLFFFQVNEVLCRMGASSSVFSEQALEDYQELTYFTKKEILHVHKRFSEVVPGQQGLQFNITTKVPMKSVLQLEELKVGLLLCGFL